MRQQESSRQEEQDMEALLGEAGDAQMAEEEEAAAVEVVDADVVRLRYHVGSSRVILCL